MLRTADLDALATAIALHGIGAYERELRAVAAAARAAGAPPALVGLIADPAAAPAARARAFGRVAAILAHRAPTRSPAAA